MRRIFARLFVVCLLPILAAGCQTIGEDAIIQSSAPVELGDGAAGAIAGDLATRLAEQVGAGTGTIVIDPDGSSFGNALETALQEQGFAVASDQETESSKAISLAYVIADHDGQILARLSTGSVELGRAYQVVGDVATPSSPLSVMRRE